jgi:hypothetical protein
MNITTPEQGLPARSAVRGQADDMLPWLMMDSILIVAIALLVFVPNSGRETAVREASAVASTDGAVEAIRIIVENQGIEVEVEDRLDRLNALPEEIVKRIAGAQAAVDIRKEAIAAAEMLEITRFYARAGLRSWTSRFRPAAMEDQR